MKTIKSICSYKIIFVFIALMHLNINDSMAGDILFKIEKEKEVSTSSVIYITSSTNMAIHTWNQNKVKQVVEITVDPVDSTKARELVKEFNFEIKTTLLGNIDLTYDLGIKQMGELTDGRIKTKKGEQTIVLDNGRIYTVKKLNVSIVLYIPRNNELVLKGRFSNISLDNLSNKVTLNLNGVTLKANDVKDLELDASFSKIWFSSVNNAVFETRNCEINANGLEKTEIESSFSKFNITKAGNLKIQSSTSDTYTIREIEVISGQNTSFTNYTIGELKKSMNISSQNGDIVIENLSTAFSQIDISNTFSTIKIGTLNTDGFILNANTEFTEFNFEKDIKLLMTKDDIKTFYKGSKSAKQEINIECKSCNVNLK